MAYTIYQEAYQSFTKILDFLRFGVSRALNKNIYFGHGTDNAWDDIWMLVSGSLSLPFDINPEVLNASLTDSEKKLLIKNLEMRIEKNVPVPYITKEAFFCGLPFYIDERALIPRSPIAELIKQQFTPWIDPEKVTRILDLCTGSACIAIACCYAFPDALVDAIDISEDALAVAKINKEKHNLSEQLNLIRSDCFANLNHTKYDIIVSNPPYVSAAEMQTLPAEYNHEPRLALQSAEDGLEIVTNILHNAKKYLSEDGILVVEVGNSEEALIEAFPDLPFMWLDFENGGQGVFLLTYEQLQML